MTGNARPAGASEKATRAAYANPRFLDQARYRRDYSHRHCSHRSYVAVAALIATRLYRWEKVHGFGLGVNSSESGGPERSRTSDNLVRSQVLYPAELQARRNNTSIATRLRYPAPDFNSARQIKFPGALAGSSAASLFLSTQYFLKLTGHAPKSFTREPRDESSATLPHKSAKQLQQQAWNGGGFRRHTVKCRTRFSGRRWIRWSGR
jgi:hypothetical protein